jgi:hypothetical protein
MEHVRFRCLILLGNWSTSANEDLLIAHYKAKGECKWNSSGFGAKDVGRERDSTEPNWFDRGYPINADYSCWDNPDKITIRELLVTLKAQLPFTFRYEVDRAGGAIELNLKGVSRTALALIAKVVQALGSEWQATILKSHIILYKGHRPYKHGETVMSR